MNMCKFFLLLISVIISSNARAEWVVYDNFNDGAFDYKKWLIYQRVGIRGVGASEIGGKLVLLSNLSSAEDVNYIRLGARRVPSNMRGIRIKYSVSESCAYDLNNPSVNNVDNFRFYVSTGSTFESLIRSEDERVYTPLAMVLEMDSRDESEGVIRFDGLSGLYFQVAGSEAGFNYRRSFLSTPSYNSNTRAEHFFRSNRSVYTNRDLSMTMFFHPSHKVRTWSNLSDYAEVAYKDRNLVLSQDAPPPLISSSAQAADPGFEIGLVIHRDPSAVEPCSVSINKVEIYLAQ